MSRRNMTHCIINPQGHTRGTILPPTETNPTTSREIRRCDIENTTATGYPQKMCWIACDMMTSRIPAS